MATALAVIFAGPADRRGITQAKALCANVSASRAKEQPATAKKCAQRQPNTEDNYGKKLTSRRLRLGQPPTRISKAEKTNQKAPGSVAGRDSEIFDDLIKAPRSRWCRFFEIETQTSTKHLAVMAYGHICSPDGKTI